jgi:hypothetical protein
MARKTRFADPKTSEHWAIAKGAPPRGSGQPITSITRGLIRFWLTGCGIPSEKAVTLTVAQMSAAWHDLSGQELARLKDEAPITNSPAPVMPEPTNTQEQNTVTHYQPNLMNTPAAPKPTMDKAAALEALQSLFAPQAQALDENAVLAIIQNHMGQTIAAATTSATEMARLELSDLVEQARAIVNGAPRTLRIEIKDRIQTLPAAPRHPLFDTLLVMVIAGREIGGLPVMIVGPAGSGKTTAAEHVAQAIGLPFFTNGALTGAHELTGYKDAAGTYHTTPLREAFEHGGLYLMDEMDRSDPAAVLALNSALANGFMSFPDRAEPIRAHADFVPMVAANTYGRGADRLYVGANQLDAATLDRFCVLSWDYDEALERSLTGDDTWTAYIQAARAGAAKLKIRHVISPRASMAGATLRRAGLAFDTVADAVLWKGLDQDQRARITAEIPEGIARRAQAPRITAMAAE